MDSLLKHRPLQTESQSHCLMNRWKLFYKTNGYNIVSTLCCQNLLLKANFRHKKATVRVAFLNANSLKTQ